MFATWRLDEENRHKHFSYVYDKNCTRRSLKLVVMVKIKECSNLVFGKYGRSRIYHTGELEDKLLAAVNDLTSQIEGYKGLLEKAKNTYKMCQKSLKLSLLSYQSGILHMLREKSVK